MAAHKNGAAIHFFCGRPAISNNMPSKTKRDIAVGVLVFFAILFLIDRYTWAQVSQWREDQAANLWLGYTARIAEVPVGLISSVKLPNPNGMIVLGSLLSSLPSLLAVSFFLGVAQMIAIVLAGWKASGRNPYFFLLAALPPLSSFVLRSASVEFWNQYTVALLNILFLFWALRYLENASPWNLPPIIVLILLAPSLYLAGIVNAIAMALLTIGIVAYKRPLGRGVWIVLAVILLLVLLSASLTWLPYFQRVGLEQVLRYREIEIDDLATPPPAFKHADVRLLSPASQTLSRWANNILLYQAGFALAAFFPLFFAAAFKSSSGTEPENSIHAPALRMVILSGGFVILSYLISARLGGPDWRHGARPDQTVQFLPMFFFFVFLLPVTIAIGGRIQKIVHRASYAFVALFVTVNLLGGAMMVRDHLQYRGDVLSEADVPLIHKMQVVDFIAGDWKTHSGSDIIPVDYDLGGGKWDWVPRFGRSLTEWYPAPMTEGRSFDYDLLRRYGLTNAQEGVQLRAFGGGRYLVTYAFETPPEVENGRIAHYYFGRLRVSIVEK